MCCELYGKKDIYPYEQCNKKPRKNNPRGLCTRKMPKNCCYKSYPSNSGQQFFRG